jgi:hypothetical protein
VACELAVLLFLRNFCVKFFAFTNQPTSVVGFEPASVILDAWLRKAPGATTLDRLEVDTIAGSPTSRGDSTVASSTETPMTTAGSGFLVLRLGITLVECERLSRRGIIFAEMLCRPTIWCI